MESDTAHFSLYLGESESPEPPWVGFLRSEFRDLRPVPARSNLGAVLLVRLAGEGEGEVFAYAFGYGRLFLNRRRIDRSWGLRAALNLTNHEQLKSLTTKIVGSNTLHMQSTATRDDAVFTFEIDTGRSLLGAIEGRTLDPEGWGNRISGGDAVKFAPSVSVRELEEACRALLIARRADDYKAHIPWADNMSEVDNLELLEELSSASIGEIRANSGKFEIVAPAILTNQDYEYFQYSHARDRQHGVPRRELRLIDYLQYVNRGLLDVATLQRHEIRAVSTEGEDVESWSVWNCISGVLELRGQSFVLDEGKFYQVDSDFLAGLDGSIDGLDSHHLELPTLAVGEAEEAYLLRIAEDMADMLLLDQRLARIAGEDPIEVCDLLRTSGELIHMKKGFTGAGLSHLCRQATGSAEALATSPAFRDAVRARMVRIADDGGGEVMIWVAGLLRDPFVPTEVTFAIAGHWAGRSASAGLPFGSKMGLRTAAENLRRRGFVPRLIRVEIERP